MPTDDPVDRTAATPELASLEASIAGTEERWQQVLAGTYQGSDPARLVTSVVDGQGVVVQVTFAKTIARHDPAVVEEAVLAAVAAAQQRLGDALAEVAAEVVPGLPRPARPPSGAENWRTAEAEPADGPEHGGGVLGRDGR